MGGWLIALAAAAFWAGIVAVGNLDPGPRAVWPALLLLAGVVTMGGAAVLPARQRAAGSRLWRQTALGWAGAGLAFALLGGGWCGLHDARVRGSPLTAMTGRALTILVALDSEPMPGSFGWTASAATQVALLPGNVGMLVHDSLWLEGRALPPPLPRGERVLARGVLQPLRGSFGRYLRHRGYVAILEVDRLIDRGPPSSPLVRAANWTRHELRASLARTFPQRDAGLLMGLILGDTSRLDPALEESFRATGLSHLTAVSGENLAMFLAPVLGLALAIGMGTRGRCALGLGAVAFFVLLTGGEPSVLRAAAMSGLALMGVFLGRPRSPPAVVGGAVLLLLAIDPTLVYAVGFQLSVGATAGMALLAGPISERLRFLPRSVAVAAGTTISAQAGVFPLLLFYFSVVPTVTVPANLLAFPAVGPGMLLGLVAGAAGLAYRPAGMLAALAARVPLGYLEGLAERLAHSPLPQVTSLGGGVVVLLAGFVLFALIAAWVHTGRKLPRRAVVAAILALPLLVWSGGLRAGAPRFLTVVFFDVGQGDAALVRSPGGAFILIDGGPDPELVAVKLASLGVRRLDLLVATHPHADHVAGLPAVLARFGVALAIDPGCRGDSPFYASFLRAVRSAGVPFRHPRPGVELTVGDIRLDVLGPQTCAHGTDSDPNNDSLVLRVSVGRDAVLFAGDAEDPEQAEMLRDAAPILLAPVLKVPHHGGDTSLEPFIRAVHASVAVVSVGPNRYGHPVPEVLAGLRRDGMRIFRTDRSGDLWVTFSADGAVEVGSSR